MNPPADLAAPALEPSAPEAALLTQVAAALGLQTPHILAAQWLGNNPAWLALLLDSPATVLQLHPDPLALHRAGLHVAVTGIYPAPEATLLIARSNREARAFGPRASATTTTTSDSDRLEVRAFTPVGADKEVPPDASLLQWLIAQGHLT